MKISELEASGQPVCVGHGVLSVNHVRPVTDGFICTGARKQGRHGKGGMPKHSGNTAAAHGSRGCCSVMQKVWSHTR